ncbi:hypothetical protein ACXVUM_00770 [Williamsia sp. SKLECPSW1]
MPLTERRTLLLATLLVITSFLLLLVVHLRRTSDAPDPADLRTPAGATIAALTGPHPTDAVPLLRAATTELGYTPVVVDGRPTNPHGDCSSPIPLPARFRPFCAAHDLGYDVLRWAARSGHPLGSWARLRLDATLVTAMRHSCDDPACTAAADMAFVGLAVNTWRQHDGVPVAEDAGTIASSVVLRVVQDVDR